MKKRTLLNAVSITVALLLFCSGCYAPVGDSESPTDTEPTTQQNIASTTEAELSAPETVVLTANGTHERNNQHGTLRDIGFYPSADGGGFYLCGSVVRYYDIEQQVMFPACALPGCAHKDDTCSAWISADAQSFLDAGSFWYAFVEDDHGLALIRLTPRTGERSTVHRWDNTAERFYSFGTCFYAADRIFVRIYASGTSEGGDRWFMIEPTAERIELLLECTDSVYGEVIAASENYMLLSCSKLDAQVEEIDAYLTKHPEQAADDYYDSYLASFYETHSKHELRRYDLNTMNYTVLDMQMHFYDEGICIGNALLFRQGTYENSALCLYDLETEAVRTLVTAENVINAWLMDGRLFYLSYEPELTIHVFDPTTGEAAVIDNNGRTDAMTFGIHQETDKAFIGLYQGKRAWIDKNDFYAARYDQAVFF